MIQMASDPYDIKVEFSPTAILHDMEAALRNPQNDQDYLINQLRTLAEALYQHGQGSQLNGLCMAALGGIYYCTQRLLDKAPLSVKRQPSYFADIYATAELSSFAETAERRDENLRRFAAEYTFVGVTPHVCIDNVTRYAFVSMRNQTTQDGRVYAEGELVDPFDRLAAPWQLVVKTKE